jgi:hypothetical protein
LKESGFLSLPGAARCPSRSDWPPVNEYQPGKLPLVLLNREKEKARSPGKEETGFKLAQVERPASRT